MYQPYNNLNLFNNMNLPFYNQNIQFQNNKTQLVNGGNWRLSYLNSINENKGKQTNKNKYTFDFNTSSGHKSTICIDEDKTVSHLIQVYLAKVGTPQLYKKDDMIKFLHSSKKIPMDCEKTIKDYFSYHMGSYASIVVIDTKNLIGA